MIIGKSTKATLYSLGSVFGLFWIFNAIFMIITGSQVVSAVYSTIFAIPLGYAVGWAVYKARVHQLWRKDIYGLLFGVLLSVLCSYAFMLAFLDRLQRIAFLVVLLFTPLTLAFGYHITKYLATSISTRRNEATPEKELDERIRVEPK